MSLITRAIRICTQPSAEWRVIAGEPTPPARAIFGYLVPLMLLVMLVPLLIRLMFIWRSLADGGMQAGVIIVPITMGLISTIAGCVAAALILNGFAATFHGTPDRHQAFKLAVYAYTPLALISVLQTGQSELLMSVLQMAGAVYAGYLLFTGIPVLMKAPADRALPYALVAMIGAWVVGIVVTMVLGLLIMAVSALLGYPPRIV